MSSTELIFKILKIEQCDHQVSYYETEDGIVKVCTLCGLKELI